MSAEMELTKAFQNKIYSMVGNSDLGIAPRHVVSNLPVFEFANGNAIVECGDLTQGDEGCIKICWECQGKLFCNDSSPPSRKKVLVKVLHGDVIGEFHNHPLVTEAACLYVINRALPDLSAELFGLGTCDSHGVMMVMEKIEGDPLSEVLCDDSFSNDDSNLISLFSFVSLFLGLKSFLRVIHGDLHPGNILRTGSNSYKIIDFGHSSKSNIVDTFDKLFGTLSETFGINLEATNNLKECVDDINKWKLAQNSYNMSPGCVYWFSIARKYGYNGIANSLFNRLEAMIPVEPDTPLEDLESFVSLVQRIKSHFSSTDAVVTTELAQEIVTSIMAAGTKLDGNMHHWNMKTYEYCGIESFGYLVLVLPNPLEFLVNGMLNHKWSLQGISVRYWSKPLIVAALSQCFPTPYMMSLNAKVRRKLGQLLSKERIEMEAEFLFQWLLDPTPYDELDGLWLKLANSDAWVNYRNS